MLPVATPALFTNQHLSDLNPLDVGDQSCPPGYAFGPAVRRYTLIHQIASGCGTVEKEGVTLPVHSGEAFLILPGETSVYRADTVTPWHYRWVAFDGRLSEDFRSLPTVFPCADALFDSILAAADGSPAAPYQIASCLFALYAALLPTPHRGNGYIRAVKDHIKMFYMHPLHVEEIAARMGLDRRYLSRLFKAEEGVSIQEYLVRRRLEEARTKIAAGMSVQMAARMCGYEDLSNFSRMFRRKYGHPPSAERQGQRELLPPTELP